MRKLVVIGGGTGSFTLLSSLKNQPCDLTALVNMADDGGSTGILRDELGVLPPGDVRQCLVALSESSQTLRDLFNYRFPDKTSLAGHSFGNLFLSAAEMISHDFAEAVQIAGEVLNIKGRVVPITLTKTTLHMATADGEVKGQFAVAKTPLYVQERPRIWLHPTASLNPEAAQAIADADMVVIAPGDLYASLLPALLVDGVKEALQNTRAKVVYICNLINKPHQTQDFAVHDYVQELERFIGEGTIDTVLYNADEPEPELLANYALENEFPVKIVQERLQNAAFQAVGGHFLSRQHRIRNDNDKFIKRSLIRHDGEAVARKLLELLGEV